jgi:hypothetical protein
MRTGVLLATLALACAAPAPAPRYTVEREWRDLDPALQERYPAYFTVIFSDADTREPDLRPLRRDIEHTPVDGRNYQALHAAAIGYFELNYRAERQTGDGLYLGNSFRAAHLAAVPWKAYGLVDDENLRDAILDFFDDVGSGGKAGTSKTAYRLATTVESLEKKESDPARRDRIRRIGAELRADAPAP